MLLLSALNSLLNQEGFEPENVEQAGVFAFKWLSKTITPYFYLMESSYEWWS